MTRLACILSLAIAGGCDLSEDLDGEPCDVPQDCWHKQECARTEAEQQAGLPGICVEKGTGCAPGQQLGCACDPEDGSMDCSNTIVPLDTEYPAMMCEPTQRVCVLATQDASTEG
jgi:hypothetical protein